MSDFRLYAIRRTSSGDISYYNKLGTDDVYDGDSDIANVVSKTIEYSNQFFEYPFPINLGNFVQRADGVYVNMAYLLGLFSPITVINIHADGGANLALTNQANAEQYLGNSVRNRIKFDATNYREARLICEVITASTSVNSPRLYLQYSLNGTIWVGTDTPNISLSSAGSKETTWTMLPVASRADIYFRVAQNGGDGADDPALGNVNIQFR